MIKYFKRLIFLVLLILGSFTFPALKYDNNHLIQDLRRNLIDNSLLKSTPLKGYSIDNLKFEQIDRGLKNFCYKCHPKNEPEKAIFIKHAKENIKRSPLNRPQQEPLVSPTRLKYEFEGMKSFAKYTPHYLPGNILYDRTNHILISEYLEDFNPLSDILLSDTQSYMSSKSQNDFSIIQMIGQLMGRNHAKTFYTVIPYDQSDKYKHVFSNKEHFELWNDVLFSSCIDFVQQIDKSAFSLSHKHRGFDSSLLTRMRLSGEAFLESQLLSSSSASIISPTTHSLLQAIQSLQQTFLHCKETLVHGDLNTNNILFTISPTETETISDSILSNQILLKFIDFEQCSYGPAGLDIGLLMSSYLWFYIAHSHPKVRQTILTQVIKLLDQYQMSFSSQFIESTEKFILKYPDTDQHMQKVRNALPTTIYKIIVDCIGFAALHLFFLTIIAPEMNELPDIRNLSEFQWGDVDGRLKAIERRRISMILQLFSLYSHHRKLLEPIASSLDSHQHKTPQSVNLFDPKIELKSLLQSLVVLLRSDDQAMVTEHFTEFWY